MADREPIPPETQEILDALVRLLARRAARRHTMAYGEYKTKRGTFRIVPWNGRFSAMYEDGDLGSYASPQQAIDDLVGGHTFSTSNGVDTSRCGLSQDVTDWLVVQVQCR